MMAKAREVSEWNHTSLLAMILAECNRDPEKKKEPYTMMDFHFFRRELEKAAGKNSQAPAKKRKFRMEEVREIICKGMRIPT